jgi:predicted MPP superfamily phosphohydrolase
MQRSIMFFVVSVVLLGIDFYAYQGLKVAISPLPELGQRIIKWIFWGLTIFTIAGFILYEPLSKHQSTRPILMMIVTIGSANMIGKLLFAIWLLIDDVRRSLQFVWTSINPESGLESVKNGGISRSEFISQAGAVTAALPIIGMGWGVLSGAHDYRVLRRTVNLPDLPKSFDGFTITQISDIHAGSFWNKKAVARGVEMINAENSDIIFFTGDLVNNKAEELNDWKSLFSTLEAKHGVKSVLGNHDYGDYVIWSSPEEKKNNLQSLMDIQKEMGWDLLIDEHRKITIGEDSIAVLGIQNWGAKGRFPKYGDLSKANEGLDPGLTKLLLSHDPSHWKDQVLPDFSDIDLMFSGHTHGFQFGIEVGSIKWSPVKYFYPEWADLYSEGRQHLYVNRGFGYLGYPGRMGILPEITVITLKTGEQSVG